VTILHPRGILRYRADLHDATDHSAVGEHVEVVRSLLFSNRPVRARCSSLNPPPTATDKALGQALDQGSTTMLAEIFLLRMEAIYRASKESAAAGNSRFVLSRWPRSFSTPAVDARSRAWISGTLIDPSRREFSYGR
jgi:hypothetical protein